ncbi:MAG: glycosyltransferase [Thiocapsa sp.]|uniref:glycosyltransferase n=1 Tax=Thiocapsa sp. TaxID=2024551 RepID=UPI001BCFCC70|nr:glycosyltransferase [Thiocapsa sp.]QVL50097.1 MAG: glycosyltransferase [Thiocapsa sp.]
MKVFFISHGFPPMRHSGTFRSEAFVRYLPEFGIEPIVFTANEVVSFPIYDAGRADHSVDAAITPKVIRCNWRNERPEHTGVREVLAQGLRFPLVNTLVVQIQRSIFAASVGEYALRCVRSFSPSVIYASSPPVDTIVLARYLSIKTGLPYICDLRDPWTYFYTSKYRSYLDFLLERAYERWVLKNAAWVISNTEQAKRQLTHRVGIKASNIHVIPNGYDPKEFEQPSRTAALEHNHFNIVYTGLLSPFVPQSRATSRAMIKCLLGLDYRPVDCNQNHRSPYFFLRGLSLLVDRHPTLRQRIRCHFVGAFDSLLLAQLNSFEFPEMLQVHDAMTQADANEICKAADLLLLLQLSMKVGGKAECAAVPGKLFNYLRTGVPILAPMEDNDAAEIIRVRRAGYVCPPEDVNGIAFHLEHEFNDWQESQGRMNRDHPVPDAVGEFDRRSLTGRLAGLLESAAIKGQGL